MMVKSSEAQTRMQQEHRRKEYKAMVKRGEERHEEGMTGGYWSDTARVEIFLLETALSDSTDCGITTVTVALPMGWTTKQAIRDAPLHQIRHNRRVSESAEYRTMLNRKRLGALEHIEDLEDAPDYFVDALGEIHTINLDALLEEEE